MTVFLVGSSSIINSVIYSNTLLFNQKIDRFVVLLENEREYFSFNSVPVLFFSSIQECISISDVTIVFNNVYIPQETILSVWSISSQQNKPVYCIEKSNKNNFNDFNVVINKPCILHIFVGRASQQFEGEALMNSIFVEKSISFKNTNKNSCLLSWYSTVSNYSIMSKDNNDCVEYDVLYVPLLIEKNIMELRCYWNYLEKVRPDYVIVQTDCSYNNYNELCEATRYLCNHTLDIWIKSRYYNYEEKGILSYQNKISTSSEAVDINSPQIINDISLDILSKMTFPIEIKKYI